MNGRNDKPHVPVVKASKPLRERDIHQIFRAEAKRQGFTVRKVNGQMNRGIFDLIVTKPGFFAFIELKTDKGYLTKLQLQFQADVQGAGVRALVFNGAYTREETKAKAKTWLARVRFVPPSQHWRRAPLPLPHECSLQYPPAQEAPDGE